MALVYDNPKRAHTRHPKEVEVGLGCGEDDISVDDALVHFVRALNSHLLRLHLIILGRQPVYEFLVKVRQMETYTNDFEKLVALAMDTELLRIQICQDLVAR